MRATKRKFPETDLAKAYSLVGGIFFLRFVNAALTSPNQYGLLDASPSGTMKTNLKLLARLMQRLSNNSAKPADEWPVDARRFMKANVFRFHEFLASLTLGAGDAKIPPTDIASQSDDEQKQKMAEEDRNSSDSSSSKSTPPSLRMRRASTGGSGSSAGSAQLMRSTAEASSSFTSAQGGEQASSSITSVQGGELDDIDMPTRPPVNRVRSRGRQLPKMLMRPPEYVASEAGQELAAGLALVPTGTTLTATSTAKNACQKDKSPMTSIIIKNTRSKHKNCRLLCTKDEGDDGIVEDESNDGSIVNPPPLPASATAEGEADTAAAADDSYSVKSMYDIGRAQTVGCSDSTGTHCDGTTLKSSGSSDCHDVVLPLNDLYLLQKYLSIYEDKWAPGEAKYIAAIRHQKHHVVGDGLTPMAECLSALGPIPMQVRASNNHKTRIPLTF
ncbi:RasGAP protein [Coemansia aciculifera]|uniref:RasGAP protein n=1 Tax=Coemansia aciculifera TaxID=417176 RepID=A0ACC1M430_9FUNG|nr:RasGAP protein [Coemansia aciculifera]